MPRGTTSSGAPYFKLRVPGPPGQLDGTALQARPAYGECRPGSSDLKKRCLSCWWVWRIAFCLSSPMRLPEYYSGFLSGLAIILGQKKMVLNAGFTS